MSTNILAINVGNTTTRIGFFDEAAPIALQNTWEICTPRYLTADEAYRELTSALDLTETESPSHAVLSSVVPALTFAWQQALTLCCNKRPLVVGPGLKTGIKLVLEDPASTGADRIACVRATLTDYGAPAIVVSLGTTTHIEVLDTEGAFIGGIIAPGLELGAAALASGAAKLSCVELRPPKHVIGKNTTQAIRSGVVLGEASRINGLIEAVLQELNEDASQAQVILTGDRADNMAKFLKHRVIVDETLLLRGLYYLWEINKSRV